ncbi:MAG: AMP-binding protein [Alphaproteobacteria bacterium]|nr:AMP-binding protein [Alphaproteobacteria bacterium]
MAVHRPDMVLRAMVSAATASHLAAALLATAEQRPRALAIAAPDRTIAYGALGRAVLGTAAALFAAGVRPGDPAGLVVSDAPNDLIVLFALYRLGVPIVILSPQETAAERRGLLRRIGAGVCVGAAAHRVDDGARHLAYEHLPADGDPARLPPPPAADAVAYFNRSSGTTLGQVKLVGITHAQRMAREATLAAAFPRGPDDRHIHLMTLANAFARSAATTMLQCGGAVLFPPPLREAGALARFAREAGVTIAALSPPYIRDLLRYPSTGPLLPGVRLLVGTAALTTDERRRAIAHVTPHLHIGYSTNEAGYLALAGPADLAADIDSVGRALPGVEAEIVDEDLKRLPPGTPGELRFRHPGFPAAYVDEVAGSTSRFRDGWFYPGDAGTIAADGRITLHGRIDDVINVGGRKVHPTAIESWLADHPEVAEAAVVALPAQRIGQAPVATVVLRRPVAEADLMAACRARGGSLPMPARIVAVPSIPRNRAGKVDRSALIALLRAALAL